MDENDHRRLGQQLDLWHIQEDAPGMIFWHPRGYALYRVLEDHIRGRMKRLGYGEVRTPQLLPRSLWERSGHWDKFSHAMFIVRDEDRDLALKPMSCPGHLQIFNERKRSWRELPLRYAEFGACHRNESSGSMHGLMRTRAFEQDDAHVVCREQDVRSEVARFAALLKDVYAELGFGEPEVLLSTRPDVRAGDDAQWDWAEAALGSAASDCGLDWTESPGEGAFYGPKLEFSLRDRHDRLWQCGTIQLDSVLPGRLGALYVGPDGSDHVPVMIHHAVFGSMGRLIALLLEQHDGRLPVWLSPEQVAVTPIGDGQAAAARSLVDDLVGRGVRAVHVAPDESLSRRIVAVREMEIPFLAVIGDREIGSESVSLRARDGTKTQVDMKALAGMIAPGASG